MRRLFLMMLVAASLATIAPAIGSSTAFAFDDQPKCDVNGWFQGPYWWGSVSAANHTGARKVLAVSIPYSLNSYTYIWDFNNDLRQEWYMDCAGYDYETGRNIWLMRYANGISLCLADLQYGNPAVLVNCNETSANQRWEKAFTGNVQLPFERNPASYTFYNWGTQHCLDVMNDDFINGSVVGTWTCHYGPNQEWY